MKNSEFINWFETFLEEKNHQSKQWEIKDEQGETHYIGSDFVIHAIKKCPHSEQERIRRALVMIDFKNGDINQFFKHLAYGLVNNYIQSGKGM